MILLIVSFIFMGALIPRSFNSDSCLDSNTFIENYWNYALRVDFWNIVTDADIIVCQYGCFENRCLTAEEARLNLPSAPDLPPEPSVPVGLD